jgi:hypothetical protein
MESYINDKLIYDNISRDDIIKLTVLYLDYRNFYYHGWVRYSIIRNIIRHITGLRTQNHLRVIFNNLLNAELFESKRIKGKIFYRYNPHKKKDKIEGDKIVLNFD